MLTTYRRLLDLLDARERRRFYALIVMIVVMGLVDMAGVASILPFLAVLANPEVVQTNPWLAAAYGALAFESTHAFLIALGALTFTFIVLGQAFKMLAIYALTRFSKFREFTIGRRLLAIYLSQPYCWFLDRHSADLGKSVLSEVDKVIQGIFIPALRLLAQGTVAFFLVALLVLVQPFAATSAAVVIIGTYGLIFMVARRRLTQVGDDRVRANEERYRMAQEALGGIKEVKLMGLENVYLERFSEPSARFVRHQAVLTVIAELPRYVLETIVFGGMMTFLLLMLTTAEGHLDNVLPVIGVYAFAGVRLFPALQQLYASLTALRFYRPALDALHADLGATPHDGPSRPATTTKRIRLRRRLELDHVCYTYPAAQQTALNGLNLTVEANTTVGIIGATGAGKTTVIDVILGLLSPQRGTLRVDGTVINSGNVREWQRSLGYVPQQIFLADDTVAANIAFGVPLDKIDMRSVVRAASVAELHEFITSELPYGYNTKVGERGVRLSGGQRQRIGIARALYSDPDVLILDEATSALDSQTEKVVMDAVNELGGHKTIIQIAHRLSTVHTADRIYIIECGNCSAPGSYDDLADNHPFLKDLLFDAAVK